MRGIVNLFAVKARIKLNPKKLYQADSEAVSEILKITTVLYKVVRTLHRHRHPRQPKKNKQQLLPFLLKFPTLSNISNYPTKSANLEQDCMTPLHVSHSFGK